MSCHYYRQTSFYFASLHCTLQLLHFLQIEVLWQPCIEQVYRCHFSNGVCSFCVSVSHLGNSCNISLFHYYHFLWSVISHTIHATMTHWKFRWWLAFFSNNIFKLMYICFFRCNAVCVCVCVCVCWSPSHVRLLQPKGLQPTRVPCPWNSPSKNTGVGCCFLPPDVMLLHI